MNVSKLYDFDKYGQLRNFYATDNDFVCDYVVYEILSNAASKRYYDRLSGRSGVVSKQIVDKARAEVKRKLGIS